MIYTVFFENDEAPQDFETYEEAIEYAESKDQEYVVEITSGEVIKGE